MRSQEELAAEAAIASVERRICQLAGRLAGREWPFEDLCQEGRIGAFVAWKRFDPCRGFKFLTYADFYIQQGMRRYCMSYGMGGVRLPVYIWERGLVEEMKIPVASLSVWEEADRLHGYEEARFDLIESQIAWQSHFAKLSLPQQQVLTFHFVYEATFREIGELLGISHQRAAQHQTAAIKRLRKLLLEEKARKR